MLVGMAEHGRYLEIETSDGPAEAYLAGTAAGPGAPASPGVLMYMDAIGLRPRLHEMADQVASWGYVVLAPNVFHRDGRVADLAPATDLSDPGAREAYFEGAMRRVRALTTDQAVADAGTWVDALLEHATAPIGVVGYCMGARLAVRTAAVRPDAVAAVAGFHGGGLVTDEPSSPHLAVAGTRAEYLFGHADQDRSMPAEAVTALGRALEEAGVPHRNEVYPGAPHGYSMSDTSAWHAEAADRSFTELRDLLDRTIGVPGA